jgi:hypothetical protein
VHPCGLEMERFPPTVVERVQCTAPSADRRIVVPCCVERYRRPGEGHGSVAALIQPAHLRKAGAECMQDLIAEQIRMPIRISGDHSRSSHKAVGPRLLAGPTYGGLASFSSLANSKTAQALGATSRHAVLKDIRAESYGWLGKAGVSLPGRLRLGSQSEPQPPGQT